ncbi:MAG: UDP-N-acetylmuramate--L-alanine ligase [Nannocystaceae bacterium]
MMFRKRDTHIHFIGIGGIGMSGIAEVLLNLGYRVTGTDLSASETTQRLSGLGATVHKGHSASFLGDADVVVTSSAVGRDNPEVEAARNAHIPVIPRAEMLAELMRLKQGILIAGSHGKTTTTSMVANVLHHAGRDPTSVIGGKVNGFDSNARLGSGDLMVAEADESDGSFLYLSPTVAIITNIDNEHLDHYGSIHALIDAFVGFANRVPFYGISIVCSDDTNLVSLLPRLTKRVRTYGFNAGADYVADQVQHCGLTSHFHVRTPTRDLGIFSIPMPGAHNVLNALATIVLCEEQQVDLEITRESLAEFSGVQRRFTLRGSIGDVTVVDDYAHHPTEIRATLGAARSAFPQRRLIAVFQPHRYTRVRDHRAEFARSLAIADLIVLTSIYAAGEETIDGVTEASILVDLQQAAPDKQVVYLPHLETLAAELFELSRCGDLIVTLGAGSITQVSRDLVERLAGARS